MRKKLFLVYAVWKKLLKMQSVWRNKKIVKLQATKILLRMILRLN